MNIFLIGPSRSGKTTLARRLVEAHPYLTAVSSSRWLRDRLPSATVDELTSEATRVLRAHPSIARDHVRAQMASASGGCVIEGIRNPIDFSCLFDPRSDAVVFLNGPSATSFERDGVAAIRRIVLWQIGQGLLDESRADVLGFPTGYEQAWSNILEWCRNVLKSGFSKASVPSSSFVHVPLKVPFPAEVRMDFLYRDPARATEWAPCVVFAVSSYQGHLPTLRVLLDEGRTLYDYLPLHAFRHSPVMDPAPDNVLAYRACPANALCRTDPPQSRANVYFRAVDRWVGGTALDSFDWYTANEAMHLILLDNGQLAMVPNHKIQWGTPGPLKPYRAIQGEWRSDPSVQAHEDASCLVQSDDIQAAVCVVFDRGLFLSVPRKGDSTDLGLPGGKREPKDRNSAETALRELLEETGLRGEIVRIITVRDGGKGPCAAYEVRILGGTFADRQPGEPMPEWTTKEALCRGSFGEYNTATLGLFLQDKPD